MVKCPLCNGTKNIWGSCCSGRDCGCYGLPIVEDCYMCKRVGEIDESKLPETDEEKEALEQDILGQHETQDWMEKTYPDYFKQQ